MADRLKIIEATVTPSEVSTGGYFVISVAIEAEDYLQGRLWSAGLFKIKKKIQMIRKEKTKKGRILPWKTRK